MAYLKVLDFSAKGNFHYTYLPRIISNNCAMFYGEKVRVIAIGEQKAGKQVYMVLNFAI